MIYRQSLVNYIYKIKIESFFDIFVEKTLLK